MKKKRKNAFKKIITCILLIYVTLFGHITSTIYAAEDIYTTTLYDDILNATDMLESLLLYKYEKMYLEMEAKCSEKNWNLTLTKESFEEKGNPYEELDYQGTICALCIAVGKSSKYNVTDIEFAKMNINESYFTRNIPLKVDKYELQDDGTYIKNGIYYITESGTYPTYKNIEEHIYVENGTTEIILEKELIPYGEVTFEALTPESILKSVGINYSDIESEFNLRLKKIRESGLTENALKQGIFLNLASDTNIPDEYMQLISYNCSNISSNRQTIIKTALALYGQVPYEWGGKATKPGFDDTWWIFDETGKQNGLDCSGYIQWVFMTAGFSKEYVENLISTYSIASTCEHITKDELIPGDLGLLHDGSKGTTNHVGLYLGDDKWIHCNSSKDTVSIDEVDFKVFVRPSGIEESTIIAQITTIDNPYSSLELNEDDIYLLAQTVWNEARGEGLNGWVAVTEVILNRLCNEAFPMTVQEVIYQGDDGSAPDQFQNSQKISSLIPSEECISTVRMVINGQISILNNFNVLYFRNPGNSDDNSDWGSLPFYKRINNHAFYEKIL